MPQRNDLNKCQVCDNSYARRHYCQVDASPDASRRKHWPRCTCRNCKDGMRYHINAVEIRIYNPGMSTAKPQIERYKRPAHTMLYIYRNEAGCLQRMVWVCEACRSLDGYDCSGEFKTLVPRPVEAHGRGEPMGILRMIPETVEFVTRPTTQEPERYMRWETMEQADARRRELMGVSVANRNLLRTP